MSSLQHIAFLSHRPEDHLVRALDILRKLGFELHGTLMRPPPTLPATIELCFVQKGEMGVHTLVDRIAQMPGVERVQPVSGFACGSEFEWTVTIIPGN